MSVFYRIRFIECFSARTLSLSSQVLPQFDKDNFNFRGQFVTNIFVGNLSYRTTQDELHSVFAQYGNVERVNIVTDRDSGQPRGFAFVEMTEARDAETAISQLNGAELNGRTMNVNEARPKPAGGGGGFGGPRGGRGRSGGGGGRGQRW